MLLLLGRYVCCTSAVLSYRMLLCDERYGASVRCAVRYRMTKSRLFPSSKPVAPSPILLAYPPTLPQYRPSPILPAYPPTTPLPYAAAPCSYAPPLPPTLLSLGAVT
eukprot:3892149-Rhodomonas_salina.1